MVINKSLDMYRHVIDALLCDVQTLHGNVFTPRAARLTTQKVAKRLSREGIGFLTKTLPRLGKALDKALTGQHALDAAKLGFKPLRNSQLPSFLGELFSRVLDNSGRILPTPCVQSIKNLRDILFVFYKLELEYSPEAERDVVSKFIETDATVGTWNGLWKSVDPTTLESQRISSAQTRVMRTARMLLTRLFSTFDHTNIVPRHGPGVVSTKEKLWTKYQWMNVSDRISQTYPVDEYFFVNLGHVADRLMELTSLTSVSHPAQVLLVPKDSRGPRLISCEPLDFQWIQQGLSRALVSHVEHHPLTKDNVRFTDQGPNRMAALAGSSNGRYSTLDLNEASDRVSLGLVRLLFPNPLLGALESCRTTETRLPSSELLKLNKFAPMGSALCFPVLALTVWAILTAGAMDAYPSREVGLTSKEASYTIDRIYVYGDDVIVPAGYTAYAMRLLENFGLKVNVDKSCTSGLFRESCGMDAYQGTPVTPVRIRTEWSSTPCPSSYTSWIAYATEMYNRGYYTCYDLIVEELNRIYGWIPTKDMRLACPSLPCGIPQTVPVRRRRVNHKLQKLEFLVFDVKPVKVRKTIDGWRMLQRFFAEARSTPSRPSDTCRSSDGLESLDSKFCASQYTKRRESILSLCWR